MSLMREDTMTTAVKCLPFWMESVRLVFSLVILMLLISPSSGECLDRQLTAYPRENTYDSDHYAYWREKDFTGYTNDAKCTITISASEPNQRVRVKVADADLEPRFEGFCLDKVMAYDGESETARVLGYFCGEETPTFRSTGSVMSLVFTTNKFNPRNYRGFKLWYNSIDETSVIEESSSVAGGTIAAAVIPCVILYAIIFFVVYRRCKYAQRVRRNLEATGHTPEDLRMAMVTMLDQASRGPLPRGQQGLQRQLLENMNNSASRRANGQGSRGRTRHPAGDLPNHSSHHSQPTPLPLPEDQYRYASNSSLGYHRHQQDTVAASDDDCSGYGSDTEDRHPRRGRRVRSTTKASNPQNHSQTSVAYPVDSGGVYYAGDIDEHGVLHPPGNQNHLQFPAGPTPSAASSAHAHSYLSHHLEDDRRSRGSNRSHRSGHGSERNSPRDLSAGRASPQRHRGNLRSQSPRSAGHLDTEGQTLTYYGMIDNMGPGENNSSSNNGHDLDLTAPPPSYEEAATGKYSISPRD